MLLISGVIEVEVDHYLKDFSLKCNAVDDGREIDV